MHCRRLNPVLDELAGELAGIIKIARINVDEDRHLAIKFGVQGVPALFIYKGGKRQARVNGAMDKTQLLGWLKTNGGI